MLNTAHSFTTLLRPHPDPPANRLPLEPPDLVGDGFSPKKNRKVIYDQIIPEKTIQ